MFHDQHVLKNGVYLTFCFFMSLLWGIFGVGSFPVQSGGSLNYFFQLFRYRNLALNKIFLLTLEAGMGFVVPFVWCPYAPLYVHMPPMFGQPHIF